MAPAAALTAMGGAVSLTRFGAAGLCVIIIKT